MVKALAIACGGVISRLQSEGQAGLPRVSNDIPEKLEFFRKSGSGSRASPANGVRLRKRARSLTSARASGAPKKVRAYRLLPSSVASPASEERSLQLQRLLLSIEKPRIDARF